MLFWYEIKYLLIWSLSNLSISIPSYGLLRTNINQHEVGFFPLKLFFTFFSSWGFARTLHCMFYCSDPFFVRACSIRTNTFFYKLFSRFPNIAFFPNTYGRTKEFNVENKYVHGYQFYFFCKWGKCTYVQLLLFTLLLTTLTQWAKNQKKVKFW